MKEITLIVEKREGTGKGASHKVRQDGSIPGVIYGPETEPVAVAVKTNELSNLIRREGRTNMLIDLNVDGENSPRKVIIRELQRDPVTGVPKHVDLYQVSVKRKLNLSARVNLVGVPDGVKNAGGILQQVRREIEIACLPDNIPDNIEIDVSSMNIGDSIHVKDISIDNVDIITEQRLTIATVVPPTVIKVAEEIAAEAVEGEEAEEGAEPAEGEAKPEEGKVAEGKEDKPDEGKKK
ncbi:MAG: 50S ribosomal protein L25 [Candidatus Zixiibacteriota bacterium]|nr:MAG: 50S ribosomal protein L25 [candidate division Zixibacteria bacterium]